VFKGLALAAVAVLTAVGVVCGALAYSVRHKSVTLSVDGRVRQVETGGATVGDVLEQEGIGLGVHDAVAPSPGTAVDDGSRIAVRYGRELDLTVDGDNHTYWVTATSVHAALEQIGLRFADADLSASRSAPIGRAGLDLTVRTEKHITIVDGGKRSREITTALTVGGALRDLRVDHDRDDEVEPREATGIEDGSVVRVVHVDRRTRRVEAPIPHETVVRHDDTLLEGRERVRRSGRDGVRVVTYEVVLADGERRSRRRVDTRVRTRPVARVVVRGTREPPPPEPEPSPAPRPDPAPVLSGAPCPDGSGIEGGLTSNAVDVYRAVCAQFPDIDVFYGLRPGDDGAHGDGRAVDFMVYDNSALGDRIAAWLQAHHAGLDVSQLIWEQQIWTVARSSEGWRWFEDRGSVTANHYDHVHVTVY
jgi:resuscitation-promoting factor RpfB